MLFHGTTLNRFNQIKKDGYLGTNKTIWNVSETFTTYFWTEQFIREEYSITNRREIKEGGIRYALESAEISLAQEESNLGRVVLVFDSRKIGRQYFITPDDSCEGMNHCVQVRGKIPLSLVNEIYTDQKTLDRYCLYFKGIAYSRTVAPYTNTDITVNAYGENLSKEELECGKLMYEHLSEWWIENMQYIDGLKKVKL